MPRIFLAWVVATASFAIPLEGQETPAFHTEVNLVNVSAVARAADGRLLGDLTKDDFEVLEDGVLQTPRFFARQTELPLRLGLLVDVSGSQEHFLKRHDCDIDAFLKQVLRPVDKAFAVCFGNHLRLVSDFSSSPPEIMDGLRRFAKGEYHFPEIGPKEDRDLGTALYDALYFGAIEKLEKADVERRALLVLSDGEENSSEHDLLDALQAVQDAGAIVYCIRYTQKGHGHLTARNRYGMRVMQHLASLSGGAEFDGTANDLRSVFDEIGKELRSMYDFGYASTNPQRDGSFRRVTVRGRRSGVVVRSKSGYYAR